MPDTKHIIELDGVSFSYTKGQDILHNISFTINAGDYTGIVGPNGAGKTTLLRIMLGLMRPQSGTVKLFGTELRSFRDWPRVGYVPQKVTNFDANFPATVAEVVLMGRFSRRGVGRGMTRDDREHAHAALEKVNMTEYADRLIGDLSGGQQQRVFIARALAADPEVIFLDEPTTGVDERTEQEFYALLHKLNHELGLTLVLVSHDLDRISHEAAHIICVNRTLVCDLPASEFAKQDMAAIFGRTHADITHHVNNHNSHH